MSLQSDMRAGTDSPARVSTTVSAVQFHNAQLPAVCIHTGMPADQWVAARATSRIGAQWLLLILGIFPLVLVRVLTVKRESGVLPVSGAGYRDLVASTRALRSERRRRLRRFLVLAIPLGAAAGLLVGAGLLITESSDWKEVSARRLAGQQRTWDQVAARLPFTIEEVDMDGDPFVESWALDGRGCIAVRLSGRPGDVPGSSASAGSACRPDRSGFARDVFEPLAFREIVDERYPLREGLYVDPDGAPSLSSPEPTRADRNVAAPLVIPLLVAVTIAVAGGLAYVRMGPRVRLLPKMHLDRSGAQVTLSQVHLAFARAATSAAPHVAAPGTLVSISAGAPVVAEASPQVLPGWYGDPAGHHRARYWDGSSWTASVRDDVGPGTDSV